MNWRLPLLEAPTVVGMMNRSVHPVHRDGHDWYRLSRIWCLNLYEGNGLLRINGKTFPIRPGHASITPPDLDMEYEYRGRTYLTWAHFIPQGMGTVEIPIMRDLGGDFDRFRQALVHVMPCHDSQPQRAAARLWDLLWELTEKEAVAGASAEPPELTYARNRIEQQLDGPIYIPVLARESGVSHPRLARLFLRHLGCSISNYIRDQRLTRARYLLAYYDYPVKSIARQVGFADQHQFNKIFRRTLGCAPSRYRETAKTAGHPLGPSVNPQEDAGV
jgi:AraC-like DNA-binding protein